MSDETRKPAGSPLLVVSLLIFIVLVLALRARPPAAKATTAPITEFSGERAQQVLKRLVGDGIPHPSGSLQNDVVRGRVVEELKNVGYDPAIQTGFACDEYGDCGAEQNIVTRLEGTESGPAVLLAAHYDSVPAGPGASDDGIGAAAVIEIARAMKLRSPPRHPVVILIDDGEEAGLLGARVFVASHPWAKETRAAVNLDNRGTSGPSLMFETGSANEWVLRLYAKNVTRPATSSVFYTTYKQLPNDTDFTVFKAAGYQGVNFAIIGDEPHYHTPLDSYENASSASLQDEGADGLSMISAIANADIAAPPVSEATYFDFLNRRTVVWRTAVTLKLSIGAAILLLLELAWLFYRKRLALRQLGWGLLYFPLALTLIGSLAFALRKILRATGSQPIDWIAHPGPAISAFWALAIFLVVVLALGLARRTGNWGLWSGIWIWWTALALVAAAMQPALSYILLVPAIVAAVVILPAVLLYEEPPRAVFLGYLSPLLAAALIGLSLVLTLYTALGVTSLTVIAICAGLLLTPIAPLLARFKNAESHSNFPLPALSFVTLAVALFVAFIVPAYSAKAPEHLNIVYFQDADSGRSQWTLWAASGKLPEPMRVTTNFHHDDKPLLPWNADSPYYADAPHLDLAPPTFTILESSESQGRRVYRALLRSERGASYAAAYFPPDAGIENVSVENQPIATQAAFQRRWFNGWYHFECSTMPAKGIEMSFSLPIGKPLVVTAMDETYSLPLEGSFLVKARPFTATPFQDGDSTVVTRHVQLLP